MGTFKDHINAPQGWLHELARAEVHPEAEELLNLSRAFDPHQLVEESTVQFLSELRDCFTEYAKIFNGYSEKATRFQEVKIYSIAQTAADFMIFRNQIKLMVQNSAHGVIQLTFSQHQRSPFRADGASQGAAGAVSSGGMSSADQQSAQELLAQVGPFRDVFWTFQGEKITADQVAKFYFSEFARATRESKRSSRTNNQLLLDQIKALLQEKGLDL